MDIKKEIEDLSQKYCKDLISILEKDKKGNYTNEVQSCFYTTIKSIYGKNAIRVLIGLLNIERQKRSEEAKNLKKK